VVGSLRKAVVQADGDGFSLKQRRTTTTFLGDLLTVVKGGTGVGRHGEASRLVGWAQEAAE
jgi:hypothetical protein